MINAIGMGEKLQDNTQLSYQMKAIYQRNSLKYGLGSLRMTPTVGTHSIGPGPTSGQLALKPATQPIYQPCGG